MDKFEGKFVRLIRDGNAIIAVLGTSFDLQANVAGSGGTAAEALRDLADAIEREKPPLPELEHRSAARPLHRIK